MWMFVYRVGNEAAFGTITDYPGNTDFPGGGAIVLHLVTGIVNIYNNVRGAILSEAELRRAWESADVAEKLTYNKQARGQNEVFERKRTEYANWQRLLRGLYPVVLTKDDEHDATCGVVRGSDLRLRTLDLQGAYQARVMKIKITVQFVQVCLRLSSSYRFPLTAVVTKLLSFLRFVEMLDVAQIFMNLDCYRHYDYISKVYLHTLTCLLIMLLLKPEFITTPIVFAHGVWTSAKAKGTAKYDWIDEAAPYADTMPYVSFMSLLFALGIPVYYITALKSVKKAINTPLRNILKDKDYVSAFATSGIPFVDDTGSPLQGERLQTAKHAAKEQWIQQNPELASSLEGKDYRSHFERLRKQLGYQKARNIVQIKARGACVPAHRFKFLWTVVVVCGLLRSNVPGDLSNWIVTLIIMVTLIPIFLILVLFIWDPRWDAVKVVLRQISQNDAEAKNAIDDAITAIKNGESNEGGPIARVCGHIFQSVVSWEEEALRESFLELLGLLGISAEHAEIILKAAGRDLFLQCLRLRLEHLLVPYNITWMDVLPVLKKVDSEAELKAVIADPIKLLEQIVKTGGAAAKQVAIVWLQPAFQAYLTERGLAWTDLVPVLEQVDSMEELRSAVAAPEALLERLTAGSGPAAKRLAIALLRPPLEAHLRERGLAWTDLVPVLEQVDSMEELRG
eukprot:g1281.t1